MSNCLTNARILFVTGTDTDAGKSWVTAALLKQLQQAGLSVAAVKPLASGCAQGRAENNADIALLQRAQPQRALRNIYLHAFEPPIAPHLAARQAGVSLRAEALAQWCLQQAQGLDVLLVEGVGGWCVPLNETQFLSDWARALQAEVLLVVALRLGCINHALLTARAITADGLCLTGWLANRLDDRMEMAEENLQTLCAHLNAPLLAQMPCCKDPLITPLEGLKADAWKNGR